MNAYHARYYAMLLTHRARADDVKRYLPALMSANIDLHPHQIDAALFASRSQFRDGIILADEESLGKTIEAGIALLQASIENKRALLVLCPASLLHHWKTELDEKFSLPCISLSQIETREGVVLASYQDAYKNKEILSRIRWDLCVLDEAHQLANAGVSDHVISDTIRSALIGCPKLLLTATPMQNSLLDLYYLIRFVDEIAFGSDPKVFRQKYMGNQPLKDELAARGQLICQRTLKRQALTMQLPKRIVRTFLVPPTSEEDALSKRMSLYFHREDLKAFPKIKEHYIRLTYWKLLASSMPALHESLLKVIRRLVTMPDAEDELVDLQQVANMATAIKTTARQTAFLDAFKDAMQHLQEVGAPQKAVVFSENRATLSFLQKLLTKHGYKSVEYGGGVQGQQVLDAFKGKAQILLATDSAGTGLNLSHCAMVVNYDLPWNVQKLEQRISRCHRYGQKHDVLVLNFIDPTNRADKRLYTVLNKKLKTFDNAFGASETVLGTIQNADADSQFDSRTAEEIQEDLALFEEENKEEIGRRVQKAEADILAHFDDEVQARFKHYGETIPEMLSQMEHWLWEITKFQLGMKANFNDEEKVISIHKSPYKGLRLSRLWFGMDKSLPKGERYRLDHPLAKRVLEDCLNGELTAGELTLKTGSGFTSGMSGQLALWQLHMLSDVDYQTHPVLCGFTVDGRGLSHEDCARLLKLNPIAHSGGHVYRDEDGEYMMTPGACGEQLAAISEKTIAAMQTRMLREQDAAVEEELNKLRRWAEDESAAIVNQQKIIATNIAALKGQAAQTTDFAQRFSLNKELADLEKNRRTEEERLFYMGAEIQQKRDAFMEAARAKWKAKFWHALMFVVHWKIEG